MFSFLSGVYQIEMRQQGLTGSGASVDGKKAGEPGGRYHRCGCRGGSG